MKIPLDELQYILDLLEVKYHRTCNVYVVQEVNEQVAKFEKTYNIDFLNGFLCFDKDGD